MASGTTSTNDSRVMPRVHWTNTNIDTNIDTNTDTDIHTNTHILMQTQLPIHINQRAPR